MKQAAITVCIVLCLQTYPSFRYSHNHDGNVLSKEAVTNTGYFYFELIPTKSDLPFYFSQSIAISYTDNADLVKQQDKYFDKLRTYASSDGADQSNYNQTSSVEVANMNDCEKDRKKNIQILKDQGKTVKSTTL
jgi:hypothetical protein